MNLLCVILSFVTLGIVGYQSFYEQTPQEYVILNGIDSLICGVFLGSWFLKLKHAPNKKQFLKFGWVDFLLAIPFTNAVWAAYYPVLRILRCFRSIKNIVEFFDKHERSSKFVDCCVISIAFVLFSAISVFNCEKHEPNANIKNMSDAVWWSAATVTTIGYGDRFPVTNLGRLMAGFVMIGGVGLYASFTGFIVSKFINDERIDILLTEVKSLKEKIDNQQQ